MYFGLKQYFVHSINSNMTNRTAYTVTIGKTSEGTHQSYSIQ